MGKQKVLIITYYWPPSGGPGVQRVLKFVKYLRAFDWEPIVLTVKDGEYPAIDHSLTKDIPDNLSITQTSTLEFFALFKRLSGRKKEDKIETYILNRQSVSMKDKLFRWIRQNVFVPDARLGWVPFAVKAGKKIIKEQKPVLIFSSSPPHSLHLAARQLAQWSGLPWVADFRDPWTDAFWDKDIKRTKWAGRKNKALEYKVIRDASAVITVSKAIQEQFQEKFAHAKSVVIPNGFDSEDFHFVKKTNTQLSLVYAGHIAESQNPTHLFKALGGLPEDLQDKVQVHFYGSMDQSVLDSIAQYKIGRMIQLHGYVAHSEALKAVSQADVLLLLIPRQHAKGIITGKVYEYLAAKNFILGMGDPKGDAGVLLRSCNAGQMFSYESDLIPILRELITNWESGIPLIKIREEQVAKYSRYALTQELAQVFSELCN